MALLAQDALIMVLYGRKEEIRRLKEKYRKNQATLIVLYGRRRVGKTALVEFSFQNEVLWKFEGLEGASSQSQLKNFHHQLCSYTQTKANQKKLPSEDWTKNWNDAFKALAEALKKQKRKPVIVFFDEFQWLASMRSPFVSLFKSYWDNSFSKLTHCRFVLCGSISSFMVKKVIRSKALYGRIDTEINLKPLLLFETQLFFGGKRTNQEIIEIAMALGCIPQYLKELNPSLSLRQNLNENAFSQSGFFFQEFSRLFISHFGKHPIYQNMIEKLSQKPLNAEELAKKCSLKTGGRFSDLLFDLELAGFIEKVTPVHKSLYSKQICYRIYDEYLHFYFRFIKPNQAQIIQGHLDSSSLTGQPSYQQWQGLAFERLCRKNARLIAEYLRFSGIQYKGGSWFTRQKKNTPGAQIDLLFERADRVLTVCEMKYVDSLSGEKITQEFDHKIKILQNDYPKFGIQKVLILGKKIAPPEKIKKYFDCILFAEDIFFD